MHCRSVAENQIFLQLCSSRKPVSKGDIGLTKGWLWGTTRVDGMDGVAETETGSI